MVDLESKTMEPMRYIRPYSPPSASTMPIPSLPPPTYSQSHLQHHHSPMHYIMRTDTEEKMKEETETDTDTDIDLELDDLNENKHNRQHLQSLHHNFDTNPDLSLPLDVDYPPIHSRKRKPAQVTTNNEVRFRQLLANELHLYIEEQNPDGNCLFRSVSHQLYNDPSHHFFIRQACMDYIEIERYFFRSFVANEPFEDYLARMRHDGEWGDHLEIQALSELYGRPIEIYAYSLTPLRTYRTDLLNHKPPIRLSYHFASHYNSVIHPATHLQHLLPLPAGTIEHDRLEKARRKRALQEEMQGHSLSLSPDTSSSISSLDVVPAMSSSLPDSDMKSDDLQTALDVSRREFVSSSEAASAMSDLDRAVEQSLMDLQKEEEAVMEGAKQESLVELTEDHEMKVALEQSSRQEDEEIKKALEVSMESLLPQSTEVAQKLMADELNRAIQLSMQSSPFLNTNNNLSTPQIDIDDPQIQLALQQSMMDSVQCESSSSQRSSSSQFPNAIQTCIELGFSPDRCFEAYSIFASTASDIETLVQNMTEYMLSH